jgi:hypothetical protein
MLDGMNCRRQAFRLPIVAEWRRQIAAAQAAATDHQAAEIMRLRTRFEAYRDRPLTADQIEFFEELYGFVAALGGVDEIERRAIRAEAMNDMDRAFLALPCLRRFAVARPGRVLLYPAEDALHVVRRRIEGICTAAGVALSELDVQVITAPSLRLDLEAGRTSLDETGARLKPRLFVLDPCIASMRMSAAMSRHCSPSCASYSGATPSAVAVCGATSATAIARC